MLGNFSAATGADLQASTNATGAAALGGDWTFEYRLRDMTTGVACSGELRSTWSGLLATFTVTNTNNSGAVSEVAVSVVGGEVLGAVCGIGDHENPPTPPAPCRLPLRSRPQV